MDLMFQYVGVFVILCGKEVENEICGISILVIIIWGRSRVLSVVTVNCEDLL